jgi:hypothetical protein
MLLSRGWSGGLGLGEGVLPGCLGETVGHGDDHGLEGECMFVPFMDFMNYELGHSLLPAIQPLPQGATGWRD